MGVDFVFASFIRNAEQVHEVRDALKGWPARIIAKIENEEGLNNIDEVSVDGLSTGARAWVAGAWQAARHRQRLTWHDDVGIPGVDE